MYCQVTYLQAMGGIESQVCFGIFENEEELCEIGRNKKDCCSSDSGRIWTLMRPIISAQPNLVDKLLLAWEDWNGSN
ncbi:unnamed protein product [Allacma fusca]|uniref:Uncharacterized protein n=1 Tax=Allacma fusca TaxID=39272 RepID=A0A8J2JN23_9HEXA|nr:unnamed protein product [Allacma fusca]